MVGDSKVLIKTIIIVLILIAILYAIGLSFSQRCIQYEDCKACWKITDSVEQNNVIADVIGNCLCPKAMNKDYSNSELNEIIESNYRAITGLSANVRDICEGRAPLIKFNQTE